MNIVIFGINHAISVSLSALHYDRGDKVFGVYNKEYKDKYSVAEFLSNEDFFNSDLFFDIIYIVAGYVPHGNYNEPNEKLVQVNVDIPKNIASKFRKAHIIYLSSTSVYGTKSKSINEKTITRPENLYSKSKLDGENALLSLVNTSILRIPSLYGEGIETNNFVNRAVKQSRSKNEILLFGDGTREQNYIHFEDVAGYLFALGKKKLTGIFLALGDRNYKNIEVAEIIQKELLNIKITNFGHDNSPSFHFDNKLSMIKLEYSAQIDLTVGIKRIINNA